MSNIAPGRMMAANRALALALHELATAATAIAEKYELCIPCLVEALYDVTQDAVDDGTLAHEPTQ